MKTAIKTDIAVGAAQALAESDDLYFEYAASVLPLDGAQLSYLPGNAHVPVGSVIHRLTPERTTSITPAWIADAEAAVRQSGSALARIYTAELPPQSDTILRRARYIPAVEYGLLREVPDEPTQLGLQPVESASHWDTFRQIAAESQISPDGHANDPDYWTEAIRRKTNPGALSTYLVLVDGTPAGSVSTMTCRSTLRLKNLVVRPAFRRQGVARTTVLAAAIRDAGPDHDAIGVFALASGPARELYVRAGFAPVFQRTEWTRALTPPGVLQ